jgi:hypothetical protein
MYRASASAPVSLQHYVVDGMPGHTLCQFRQT